MGVMITIKSGNCSANRHKVGDTFEVDEATPEGICLGAFGAISPYLFAMLLGTDFPWEKEKGYAAIHCPDPNGIVLELRRK